MVSFSLKLETSEANDNHIRVHWLTALPEIAPSDTAIVVANDKLLSHSLELVDKRTWRRGFVHLEQLGSAI